MVDMAGLTFDRERIGRIMTEIERRKKTSKDYVGDTRKMRLKVADDELVFTFDVEDKDKQVYGFTRTGRAQLAESMRFPLDFWSRVETNPKNREELAHFATHLLHTDPQKRMVRTLDGRVRAVLSNSYKTLDNFDLFMVSVEELEKVKAEIWEARLSDDEFRIYAVAPGITGEVKEDRPGYKWEAGDRHVAAISIGNSETGKGKLKVRPATLRYVCWNLNVWDEGLTKIHLGRKIEEEGWMSDDTKKADDNLTWRKVRDIIRTAFDPAKFEEVIAKLNGAKKEEVTDPVKAVEAVVELAELPKSAIDRIREKFIKDKDFTRYGLVQAVTYQVHGENLSDDDKNMYEDAGAKVLATPMEKILAGA